MTHTPRRVHLDLRTICKSWDGGHPNIRAKVLEQFNRRFAGAVASDLEKELSHGASLFLARLVSSLGIAYVMQVLIVCAADF